VDILKEAVENTQPTLGLTPMRKGGAVYQVPSPVSPHRRFTLAVKWIVEAARNKKGQNFSYSLAQEILDAANNEVRDSGSDDPSLARAL
jgi:small subunit ribosomal protein S7